MSSSRRFGVLVPFLALPLWAACGDDAFELAPLPEQVDSSVPPPAPPVVIPDAGDPCAPGQSCDGECIDTQTDPSHCGGCDRVCERPPGSTASCVDGSCTSACGIGYFECDGDAANGCESTTPCTCNPGETAACYTGLTGTEGIGICKGGTKTCAASGTAFGPCVGEVVPQAEICEEAGLDENCDGHSNEGGEFCDCVPGHHETCWDGPAGASFEGTSACRRGERTCAGSGTWGSCTGQVLPQAEVCDEAGIDESCNGESNEGGEGCECVPGAIGECWDGPAGAVFGGTSVCKKGSRTCQGSGKWGSCENQTLPRVEDPDVCTATLDEDCDGNALGAAGVDRDGDGWSVCQGDCCDSVAVCTLPALVNPGAYDGAGNNFDDDCDGTRDNPVSTCDDALASNSSTGMDYAKAMDLCQTTTEAAPRKQWGVISAQLLRADGTGAPSASARSIRRGFGTNIQPKRGRSLAVLSTGHAADANDTNPPFASFQQGQDMGIDSGFPADWLAANGGQLPNAPGCPGIQGGSKANDPVMLKLRVRVPTNAHSFHVNSYFLSAEFPEWVCSPFNDFFVMLLDSSFAGAPANPADKNLAVYRSNNTTIPVGANLAYHNNGLFQACKNGTMACSAYSPNGTTGKAINTCTNGAVELVGTGFDVAAPATQCDSFGNCSVERCKSGDQIGGGTGFMTASGNVVPGETIEVRFAIWDTSDHAFDSLVLLDNFTWDVDLAEPGTVNQ